MPRTRNFLLFLIVGFVIVGVLAVSEAPKFRSSLAQSASWMPPSATDDVTYSAGVPPTNDDRAARLLDLKAKLADRTIIAAAETVPEVAAVVKTAEATSTLAVLQKCSGYAPATLSWTPQHIVANEREGVRLYTEVIGVDASTTNEIVHARIALRTWPLGTTSCLPTDVVGIATDGSLIRNGDVALYKVFSETTLIGYSLDGYPIYGVTPGVTTDSCGGAMVAGAYRYLIDPGRSTILNCFSGIPAMVE